MNPRGHHPVSIRTTFKLFAALVLCASLFTPLGARLARPIHTQAATLQTRALDPDCTPLRHIFLPMVMQQAGSALP
jgi:hypothetical protein